jgi:hypothetical protein
MGRQDHALSRDLDDADRGQPSHVGGLAHRATRAGVDFDQLLWVHIGLAASKETASRSLLASAGGISRIVGGYEALFCSQTKPHRIVVALGNTANDASRKCLSGWKSRQSLPQDALR